MNFELTGKLIEKYNTAQVSDKFKKREFVIEATEGNSNYPDFVKFQLVQDKTDLIEAYKIGETIKVHFNIRGSKWKDAYFVNLQAWRLEKTGEKTADAQVATSEDDIPPPITADDLPF